MRYFLLFTVAISVLAACSMDIPDFLGREGNGDSTFRFGEAEPLPEPVPLPITAVIAEPALKGLIVRAEGIAPGQGYHGAELIEFRDGQPDAGGLIDLAFVALPPAAQAQAQVGPPQTREQRAGRFYSELDLKDVRGIRIEGAGATRTLRLN